MSNSGDDQTIEQHIGAEESNDVARDALRSTKRGRGQQRSARRVQEGVGDCTFMVGCKRRTCILQTLSPIVRHQMAEILARYDGGGNATDNSVHIQTNAHTGLPPYIIVPNQGSIQEAATLLNG